MKTINQLNSRQWKLHEYLKKQTDYIHLKVICIELGYETPETFKINCGGYRTLVTDIKKIRYCDAIKRIPISDKYNGVKYATTNEELETYFAREKKQLDKGYKKHNKLRRKAGLDGQYVIQFTGNEKPMIETLVKEREVNA